MIVGSDVFSEELNRMFGPPFLPDGFFEAESHGTMVRIRIGDRDVTFNAYGHSISSGTNVQDAREWDVKRRKL